MNRDGFKEITSEELSQEPYKNYAKMPDCLEHNVPVKAAIRKPFNWDKVDAGDNGKNKTESFEPAL